MKQSNTILFYAIFLFCLLYLTGCSSSTITKETNRIQRDSSSVVEKPQRVETPAVSDTLYSTSVTDSTMRYYNGNLTDISIRDTYSTNSFVFGDVLKLTFSGDSLLVWYTNVDTAGYYFTEWLKKYRFSNRETFESKDKKRSVTIDRTGKIPIAIFNQAKDSIDVMVKEVKYWKWLYEKETIREVKQKTILEKIADIFNQFWKIIVSVVVLVVVVGLFLGLKKLGWIKI